MGRLTWEELDKLKKDNNVSRLWSWSKVHCFNTSMFEYYLKYIKRIKEDRRDCIYAAMGGTAHDIIERFYTGKIKYEDMIDEFEDGWLASREISQLKFDRNDEGHDKKIADKYYVDLKHFFKNHVQLKHKPVLEQFVKMKIGNNLLYGYIDCCFKDEEGCFNIVDWKTSTIYKGAKAQDECGQLVLYAIALNQLGVPFDKIKICWNFLKYCTIQYEQANGTVKTRDVERYKLGESLQTNAKMWLKKLGYEDDIDDYLKAMIDANSIDVLPDDVQEKYMISDCYVYVDMTQDLIDRWTDYVISTIHDILAREKEYQDTGNEMVFFDDEESVKKQSYYFSTLCGYSPSLLKPYMSYLDSLEKSKDGADFFSGIGNETMPKSSTMTSVKVDDTDLSWLDSIL